MKRIVFGISAALMMSACDSNDRTPEAGKNEKDDYIRTIEAENRISYDKIVNTRGAYITSMCYTKTKDEDMDEISNPCYSCHTKGKIPNYFNDTNLQREYSFPEKMLSNPFKNLFKDRSKEVQRIGDEEILVYVRRSNYFDENGTIALQHTLPSTWEGYVPDCYFHFDDEGFDHTPTGAYTLWRAYRYYPFLGTFWPTNGSTDDVLIRLHNVFSYDQSGAFDLDVYKLNLAIVEAVVKQKDIAIEPINERKYGIDIDQDGTLSIATHISQSVKSYVGQAAIRLQEGKLHLAKGLFPEGTEFLHSVRYIDWDDKAGHIRMAKRMKELRYAKKTRWLTYSQIQRVASSELWEAQANDSTQGVMATFRGDYEHGLRNDLGWVYQGFIEDHKGDLRPQTHEETIGCMGCHAHLGATTDSIFSFARKFEGIDKEEKMYGWNHWSQKGLVGIAEPRADYINHPHEYEYSFYLQNNHSGNEFRNNDEVKHTFFDDNGTVKPEMIQQLHHDISLLLFPSKQRALALDKGYRVMVEEQSFIYGRDANVNSMENVFKEIEEGQSTLIRDAIVKD